MAPILPDLPVELFDLIGFHLRQSRQSPFRWFEQPEHNEPILYLRLTCRAIHLKTLRYFGNMYFRTLKLEYGRDSFDKILSIAEHDTFRWSVRNFDIKCIEAEDDSDQASAGRLMNNSFANSLGTCLRQFARLSSIHVDCADIIRGGSVALQAYWPEVVTVVFSSIYENNTQILELVVMSLACYEVITPYHIPKLPRGSQQLFDQLTSLYLHGVTLGDDEVAKSSSLSDIVANAPNLQLLTLGGVRNPKSGIAIASVAESLGTLKHIVELEVKNTHMSQGLLEALVRACPESVRSLRLQNITLLEGKWKTIFQVMKDQRSFKPTEMFFRNLAQYLPIASTVALDAVNHMRPSMTDCLPTDYDEDEELRPGEVGWDSLSAREKELSQIDWGIYESSVWVDHEEDDLQLWLDEGDCEYLGYWLNQVIERHTMKIVDV